MSGMPLVEFESAREKERVRQELREVRAEILRRVSTRLMERKYFPHSSVVNEFN